MALASCHELTSPYSKVIEAIDQARAKLGDGDASRAPTTEPS